jgi:hypothetical protein
MAAEAPKNTREGDRGLDRVLDLLWMRAEAGNVAAQKALYEIYSRDEGEKQPEAPAEDSWESIYGENVAPLERRAS